MDRLEESGQAQAQLWGTKACYAASRRPGEPTPCRAAMSSGTPAGRRSYISREKTTEALQAKMLTKDEARRIAVGAEGLAELLTFSGGP
jgi:hypothetical protein